MTAVTAQDTTAVHAIHPVPLDIIAAQLDAVLDDLKPSAIKTGMLGTAAVARLVAERCADFTLVVDPVLRASTGARLADEELIAAYRNHLVPVATVVTPNADEDAVLGHPRQSGVIVTRGGAIRTRNDHGTGCTFASALTAHLALGSDLGEATERAHAFVARQLTLGRDWTLGAGRGPVPHLSTTQ